jgi:hypothetical protein
MFGVLTSPQAPLYYWSSGMFTSLAMSRYAQHGEGDSIQDNQANILSAEAQDLLRRAADRVAQGEHVKALSLLKQARVLAPHDRSLHMALGDVLTSIGQDKKAMYHYSIASGAEKELEDQKIVDVLSQRAAFGLAMLLSKDSSKKRQAIDLLDLAASKMDDGNEYKPVGLRALLAIAALSDDEARRKRALGKAQSLDATIVDRLDRTRRKPI